MGSAKAHKELLHTAHHEAGHAVAAIVENCPLRSVTIVPDDETLGCCITPYPRNFQPESDMSLRTARRLEAGIIACFAGHIAEKQVSGRNNWVHSSVDRKIATDLASYLTGSNAELEAYLKWLWVRTEGLVNLYQPQIAALASALLEEKTIQAKHAREIFREAMLKRQAK